MIVSPAYVGYPEVTINAPNDVNCYVYFRNTQDSSNDFAFYVSAGSSVTVNAPPGVYKFYYATGDTWYGRFLRFGEGTYFYKSPDLVVLEEDNWGYDIVEFTLYAVPGGNLDTELIDQDEFPV